MLVMDAFEATRVIRATEKERGTCLWDRPLSSRILSHLRKYSGWLMNGEWKCQRQINTNSFQDPSYLVLSRDLLAPLRKRLLSGRGFGFNAFVSRCSVPFIFFPVLFLGLRYGLIEFGYLVDIPARALFVVLELLLVWNFLFVLPFGNECLYTNTPSLHASAQFTTIKIKIYLGNLIRCLCQKVRFPSGRDGYFVQLLHKC